MKTIITLKTEILLKDGRMIHYDPTISVETVEESPEAEALSDIYWKQQDMRKNFQWHTLGIPLTAMLEKAGFTENSSFDEIETFLLEKSMKHRADGLEGILEEK